MLIKICWGRKRSWRPPAIHSSCQWRNRDPRGMNDLANVTHCLVYWSDEEDPTGPWLSVHMPSTMPGAAMPLSERLQYYYDRTQIYLSQCLSSPPHTKMPYQRKSIILQLNKTREKLNTVGADRKTLNQTQFGRWVLRLISHRHTDPKAKHTIPLALFSDRIILSLC